MFRHNLAAIRSSRAATAISLIALFVALGGSATAAIVVTSGSVKDGSLRGRDIRNGSLTGKDIKNRSVRSIDLSRGVLRKMGGRSAEGLAAPQVPGSASGAPGLPGADGSIGAQGPAGATGAQGPAGQSCVEVRGPESCRGERGYQGQPGPAGPNSVRLVAQLEITTVPVRDPGLADDGPSDAVLCSLTDRGVYNPVPARPVVFIYDRRSEACMVDLHDTDAETASYWATATPEVPADGGSPNQTVSVGLGTRDDGRLIWRVYLRDEHGEPAREGMANIVIHRIPRDEPRGN